MIDCSGIGTFLKGILPHLLAHTDTDWLLIGDEKRLVEFSNNKNVSILNCKIPIFSIKELIGFPVKKINKCDLYFSPNYNIPLGLKIPVLATIHDVVYLDVKGLSSPIGTLIRKIYLKYAISRSSGVITVSKYSAHRIKHHFPHINDICISYNGPNTLLLNASSEKNESVYPTPYYLYVGNVKPHKGLDTLIEAFQRLPESYRLLIVGSKDSFKTNDRKVTKLLENLSSSTKIVFTGRVTDNELKSIITNAEALIQPSRYEGFGLPPLEAMLLGTPVIISDIEVFKEIYSEFPVNYFRVNDNFDLESKIKHLNTNRIILDESLKHLYSYKKSGDSIWLKIKKVVNNQSNNVQNENSSTR